MRWVEFVICRHLGRYTNTRIKMFKIVVLLSVYFIVQEHFRRLTFNLSLPFNVIKAKCRRIKYRIWTENQPNSIGFVVVSNIGYMNQKWIFIVSRKRQIICKQDKLKRQKYWLAYPFRMRNNEKPFLSSFFFFFSFTIDDKYP